MGIGYTYGIYGCVVALMIRFIFVEVVRFLGEAHRWNRVLMLWCLHRKKEANTTNKQSLYYRNRFLTWLTHVRTELFVHFAGQPNYGILLYQPQHNELVVLHTMLIVYLFYTIRYYTTLYFVIAWALSKTFRSYEIVYFLSAHTFRNVQYNVCTQYTIYLLVIRAQK